MKQKLLFRYEEMGPHKIKYGASLSTMNVLYKMLDKIQTKIKTNMKIKNKGNEGEMNGIRVLKASESKKYK
jgi:hypothetical protein